MDEQSSLSPLRAILSLRSLTVADYLILGLVVAMFFLVSVVGIGLWEYGDPLMLVMAGLLVVLIALTACVLYVSYSLHKRIVALLSLFYERVPDEEHEGILNYQAEGILQQLRRTVKEMTYGQRDGRQGRSPVSLVSLGKKSPTLSSLDFSELDLSELSELEA